MGLGLLLGYYVPAVERAFDGVQIDSVSLPIAIGYTLQSSVASPCATIYSLTLCSLLNSQCPLLSAPDHLLVRPSQTGARTDLRIYAPHCIAEMMRGRRDVGTAAGCGR